MENRGPKPKGKVLIKWSPNFAYAIGLLATDGCVSKDGKSIDFTSKDLEQIKNFMYCLSINQKISLKKSGSDALTYRVQFGDVLFCKFLNSIGITSAKSLTIGEVMVPSRYFFDFLRGCFDGDGSSYSYWDKRWKSSFMFYIEFASASPKFIFWLKQTILDYSETKGHITKAFKKGFCYQLKYSKHEAIKLIKKMYSKKCIYLSRKRLKIDKCLAIINRPK